MDKQKGKATEAEIQLPKFSVDDVIEILQILLSLANDYKNRMGVLSGQQESED